MAKKKVSTVILITSAWQTQPRYPNHLAISFSQPFQLPITYGVLKNPKGEDHFLVTNKSLALVVWKITTSCPIFSLTKGDKVRHLITTRPGKNGVAVVIENKLIYFSAS